MNPEISADSSNDTSAYPISEHVTKTIRFGNVEELTILRYVLAVRGCCELDVSKDGRLHAFSWVPDNAGLNTRILHHLAHDLPLVMFRADQPTVKMHPGDRVLVGKNGVALLGAEGELMFLPAQDILGVGFEMDSEKESDIFRPQLGADKSKEGDPT